MPTPQPVTSSAEFHLPTSIEDARHAIEQANGIAYFIDANQRGIIINPIAQDFAGFHFPPEGRTLMGLMMHIAQNLLPERTPGRLPRQDFLIQQETLGKLTKGGLQRVPVVSLKLARKQDGAQTFHDVKVYAHHIFSLESEYLGTLCIVKNKEISRKTYNDYARRDRLVSPLPEEISDMVESQYKQWHQEKSLRPDPHGNNVLLLLEHKPMNDSTQLPFRSEDELKKLLNFAAFEQAIKALPDTNEGKDLMRIADKLIAQDMRQIVQRKIKLTLWQEEVAGIVSFSTAKEEKPSNTYYYLRASTNGKTKNVRPSTPEEIEEYHKDKAEESHVSRISKTGRSRTR